MDNAGLQVNQKCAGDVVLIVSLIEEHVFPIVALRRILFKNSFATDAVFNAQLLPKLIAN